MQQPIPEPPVRLMRHFDQKSPLRKRVYVVIGIIVLLLFGRLILIGLEFSPVALQLFINKDIALKKTDERVNVLLLGIGGGTHEGPLLSDTIIFASLDPQKNVITLTSIPRDLWMPELSAKINTAYAFGEEKKQGGGLILAKSLISKLLHQRIDYAVRVDFQGFEKAVDMVGGLDVNVERTLDDYSYPISGKEDDPCGFDEMQIASLSAQIATNSATEFEAFPCRYEHIHFDAGPSHMDGQTALKYVRSRHAVGPEGSDFARSKRQENVIQAFKDKIFSLGTFLNPLKLVSLYDIFRDSVDTDIKQDEYDDFVRLSKKLEKAKIQNAPLDIGDAKREGLLTNPQGSLEEYRGAWVLIPKAGNGHYAEIQEYVACKIALKPYCPGEPTPTPTTAIR